MNETGHGLRALWVALVAIAAVGLVTLWGGSGSPVLERTIIAMLINVVLVVALYIFIGNSGIFSFGHVGFMAVGAYVTSLLSIAPVSKQLLLPGLPAWAADAHASPFVALLAAGLVAGVFAAILAGPLMRLSGISAALSTFAVLITVHVVLSNWESVTGGTSGLAGIPTTTDLGRAYVWAAIAIATAAAFQQTRVCRRLRATRDDEVAASAIGIGVFNERRVAFVVSAVLTGVAGGLFAQFNGAVTPDSFYLSLSFLIIAMLVVGGMNSLTGAVVGVFVLTLVSEALRAIEEGASVGGFEIPARAGLREVGLALAMLAILILRPDGLTKGREVPFPKRLRRSSARRQGSVTTTS